MKAKKNKKPRDDITLRTSKAQIRDCPVQPRSKGMIGHAGIRSLKGPQMSTGHATNEPSVAKRLQWITAYIPA